MSLLFSCLPPKCYPALTFQPLFSQTFPSYARLSRFPRQTPFTPFYKNTVPSRFQASAVAKCGQGDTVVANETRAKSNEVWDRACAFLIGVLGTAGTHPSPLLLQPSFPGHKAASHLHGREGERNKRSWSLRPSLSHNTSP